MTRRRNNGNASSIGTSTHIEMHYNPLGKGKRSRHNCIYFDKMSGYCNKLNVHCVGISNPLCKYSTKHNDNQINPAQQPPQLRLYYGEKVKVKNLGICEVAAVENEIVLVKIKNGQFCYCAKAEIEVQNDIIKTIGTKS